MDVTITDAVFGEVTFDSEWQSWQGRSRVSLVDAVVALNIDAGETGPTEEQRAAYLAFQQAASNLLPRLQQELSFFYQSIRSMLLGSMPNEVTFFESDMPDVDTAQQVWDMITPTELMVLNEGYTGRDNLVLLWECPWDIEHGLSATFHGGELIEVESP